MRWFISLLLFGLLFSSHAAHVITNTGRRIDATQISASADGSVTIVTATGQSLTFRSGQYRSAAADRPAALAQAQKWLEAGQPEKAIPLLETVKRDCRFLAWDQPAIALLANHYFESGQFAQAAAEFQLMDEQGPDVQEKIRQALVKSGKADAVLPALEQDIAGGSREAAARAYLLRGDLKAAAGDTEGARRDWLKVATYFKAQKELAQQAADKLDPAE
ncbi:tetratricopeptide repeat protein [Pontiella sp.]|uniref:tetratricopeptide repeat protein n=1 Tax=Pontiella sp. TaxID=2837462 RepID=UPI0035645A48